MKITNPSPLGLGRSSAKRAKWKAKWLANRRARAAFNAEWKGECRGKNLQLFHEGLKALSLGLAG